MKDQAGNLNKSENQRPDFYGIVELIIDRLIDAIIVNMREKQTERFRDLGADEIDKLTVSLERLAFLKNQINNRGVEKIPVIKNCCEGN